MIVVDTNVLSEMTRLDPSRAVLRWLNSQAIGRLYTTTISHAEMLYGAALMTMGRRRLTIEAAIATIFQEDFAGRVLPFDSAAAEAYAPIAAQRTRAGRPISQFDAEIAAITHAHGATLATRNLDDFLDCGIPLISPWAE